MACKITLSLYLLIQWVRQSTGGVIRVFWGYDVFISYSRSDATRYAQQLGDRLLQKKISVFLDQAAVSDDGTKAFLYAADDNQENHKAFFLDITTTATTQLEIGNTLIRDIAFARGTGQFISCGTETRIWNSVDGSSRLISRNDGWAIALNADGSLLLEGHSSGVVLYNVADGKTLLELASSDSVDAVTFLGPGRFVVDMDEMVQLRRFPDGKLLTEFEPESYALKLASHPSWPTCSSAAQKLRSGTCQMTQ